MEKGSVKKKVSNWVSEYSSVEERERVRVRESMDSVWSSVLFVHCRLGKGDGGVRSI